MADSKLDEEQHELVYYPNRKAQRSSETVPMRIRTVVSLNRSGKGVEIEATLDNQAKDHRVRALFPTDLEASSHYVDSMFEVAKRDNEPAAEWENPSYTAHQQAFVDVTAAAAGLTVANQGLNEYEVLRDGRNTIAVTLLRSVGELGDWGYFPTPEAQCIGVHTVRMEVIPHQGDGIASGAYAEAYQFQIPWTAAQTGVHTGQVASTSAPLAWSREELAFSSLKVNPNTGDLMLRWFNLAGTDAELALTSSLPSQGVYKSNILEEEGAVQSFDVNGSFTLPVKPYEILTLGVKVSAE
jgi:alpha-mannosidase